MAISSVSIKAIAGYVSKNTVSDTPHSLGAVCVVPGNGNMTTPYQKWQSQGIGYNSEPAVGSDLDSGFYTVFNFDASIADYSTGGPVDYYNSGANSRTALPASSTGLWYSGTVGTVGSGITWTTTSGTTSGGYLASTSPTANANYMVSWPKVVKAGNTYETYYSNKKTIAFWYYCSTATPGAFAYAIADNQRTSNTNYSGFILQRPSNRTNAFTLLLGDGTGVGSGDRRSHLGVTNSLGNGKWNFVVVGCDGNSIASQSTTTNYVNITQAGAGSRTTTNNGISGTSGSGGSIGLDSASSAVMRWFWSGGSTAGTTDRIGMMWVFSEYLSASDSRLTDLWNATKGFYP